MINVNGIIIKQNKAVLLPGCNRINGALSALTGQRNVNIAHMAGRSVVLVQFCSFSELFSLRLCSMF